MQAASAACRRWLDDLPNDAELEPAEAEIGDEELADVRSRARAAQKEIAGIRGAPVPSSDIRQRVEARIAELAKGSVMVSGIGAGERLKIVWPGAPMTLGGPSETACDPLALFAALFPSALLKLAMAEVEALASKPLPLSERPARIEALERELDGLRYAEEALVVSSGEPRAADAPPWAVLQVRLAEKGQKAAAA